VGRFDGHADAPVQYGVHLPMEHVQGFMRSHWTPPSGENSPCIAPADAMVIDFWRKKSSCGVVKSLSKASVQKAQNGPSTQLIEAMSCVERSNATIKAEELS
jgi:hypothetical protein